MDINKLFINFVFSIICSWFLPFFHTGNVDRRCYLYSSTFDNFCLDKISEIIISNIIIISILFQLYYVRYFHLKIAFSIPFLKWNSLCDFVVLSCRALSVLSMFCLNIGKNGFFLVIFRTKLPY